MGWNVIPLRNTFLPNKKGEPPTQGKSSTKCHILAQFLCNRETPCVLRGLEQFPHQLPIFKASNAVELLYICFIACFNFVFSNIFLFLLSKCWRLNQNIFLNESVNLTFHKTYWNKKYDWKMHFENIAPNQADWRRSCRTETLFKEVTESRRLVWVFLFFSFYRVIFFVFVFKSAAFTLIFIWYRFTEPLRYTRIQQK